MILTDLSDGENLTDIDSRKIFIYSSKNECFFFHKMALLINLYPQDH